MEAYPLNSSLSSNGVTALPGGVPAGDRPPPRDLDPRRLWSVLSRRRKLVLAVWLGFSLAVTLFTLLQHKQYTTSVALISGTNSGSQPVRTTQTPGRALPSRSTAPARRVSATARASTLGVAPPAARAGAGAAVGVLLAVVPTPAILSPGPARPAPTTAIPDSKDVLVHSLG